MAPALELRLSLPADARLAELVRDVATHGGRQAGRGEEAAEAFGRRAEEAFRESIRDAGAESRVSVVLRRDPDPLELVLTGDRGERTLTMDD